MLDFRPMIITHPKHITILRISSVIIGSFNTKKAIIEIRNGPVVSTIFTSARGACEHAITKRAKRA